MTHPSELLAQRLHALLQSHPGRPVLAALDGRCGSGKTTLAAALARQFPDCVLLHTDDYYLPPAQRLPGWEKIPCANMDLARLRQELLVPLRAGRPAEYRPWSCAQKEYLPGVQLLPRPLVILEGSYSHHPLLADLYDLRVFVTCCAEEQARRLQAREGSRYPMFAARWIPLEEGYFAQYKIPQQADLILDTGAPRESF